MIELSKDSIKINLCMFLDRLLSLPEVEYIKIKEVEIREINKDKAIGSAMDECFHDCYSDIDLCVAVRLSAESGVSPDEYLKHTEHWGFPWETILGISFQPESSLYRIILKNGMRYDLSFQFLFQENSPVIALAPINKLDSNPNWPVENIYKFWFVQIQALGKLYRNDFLISGHLANININETLVQQMVLRDLKFHTSFHRYGYQEEFIYSKYRGQCPYQSGNSTFDSIADRIYSAALAYDELASFFYDDYEPESGCFFDIWSCYEEHRSSAP